MTTLQERYAKGQSMLALPKVRPGVSGYIQPKLPVPRARVWLDFVQGLGGQ